MPIMQGAGFNRILATAGAPVTGTDAVQTVTIGGTPTGGTFTLSLDGFTTVPITWVNVNATLIAAIKAALEALGNIGSGNTTVTAGTLTAGIGTLTVAFNLAVGKQPMTTMTATNSMTGTAPTIAVATTTPGVAATGRGYPKGQIISDNTNAILYQNTGTATAPVWTKVGLET